MPYQRKGSDCVFSSPMTFPSIHHGLGQHLLGCVRMHVEEPMNVQEGCPNPPDNPTSRTLG